MKLFSVSRERRARRMDLLALSLFLLLLAVSTAVGVFGALAFLCPK